MRKTDWNPAVEMIITMRGGGLPQSDLQDFISHSAPKEFHGSCHRNSNLTPFAAAGCAELAYFRRKPVLRL